MIKIHTFRDLAECAELTVRYIRNGNVALSGGSTFSDLYPYWLKLKPDCEKASFFPVDERMVDFYDDSSNWGTAYRRFLKPLGKESDKNHFPRTAEQYRQTLINHFNSPNPVFDVIFLGVGKDGHTASLFPGEKYLEDLCTPILQTRSPSPPYNRITLGPKMLVSAKKLITVISGLEKKYVLNNILKEDRTLPIVKVLSLKKESLLFFEKSLLNN